MVRTWIIFVVGVALAGCGGSDVSVSQDASNPSDSSGIDSSKADSSKPDSSSVDSAIADSSGDSAADTGSDASASSCARACAVKHSGGCSEFMLVGYSCTNGPCGANALNDMCTNTAPSNSEVQCVKTAIAACKADAGPFVQCSNTCSAYVSCIEACP